MQKTEKFQPESIVLCSKCQSKLWTVKVNPDSDNKVKSHIWVSWHPELFRGEPKTWDCPLCKKEFALMNRQGIREIKMVDTKTGKRVIA